MRTSPIRRELPAAPKAPVSRTNRRCARRAVSPNGYGSPARRVLRSDCIVQLLSAGREPTAWPASRHDRQRDGALDPANRLGCDGGDRRDRVRRQSDLAVGSAGRVAHAWARAGKLRYGMSGGGPVPAALKKAWRDEFHLPLVESYGQSELGGFVGLGFPELEPDRRLGAVGPPLPDKDVRIFDVDGREVPIGQVGEVCLRGGFMKALLGAPGKDRGDAARRLASYWRRRGGGPRRLCHHARALLRADQGRRHHLVSARRRRRAVRTFRRVAGLRHRPARREVRHPPDRLRYSRFRRRDRQAQRARGYRRS